jgi:endoglycosylceramidase
MMTEFGATNSVSDLQAMVALADKNMVPWLEWAYCGCNDPTTSGPGDVQAIVRNPEQSPRGSNLVMPTLRALVEPFPQLISGTPLGWGFDPSSRVFTFRYNAARASGHGRFKAGSLTAIAAPALVYGGRYAVRVKGGAIVSKRGAPVLLVASCRRARTIKVTVTASGRNRESCRAPRRLRAR